MNISEGTQQGFLFLVGGLGFFLGLLIILSDVDNRASEEKTKRLIVQEKEKTLRIEFCSKIEQQIDRVICFNKV